MRKIGISAAVLGLVIGTIPAAAAEPPGLPDRPGTTSSTSVTLVTGDRVLVRDGAAHSVQPGPGRDGIPFRANKIGDHLYVVPADAQPLVAAGRVDRRLFDITTLLDHGFDDAKRATVPLIVTGQGARTAMRAAATRDLPAVNGIALDAAKQGTLWQTLRTTADKIWLDGRRRATLDHSVPQIGAPAAWEAGFTGTGIKVAVLDTGVDQTHPDLADREVAEQNFSEAADAVDHFGHGTHVASIVAGTGAKAGGKYRGVAHGASIVDGKVLDDSGGGWDSDIIAGMRWAAEQGADVVNMSLGGGDTPEIDPIEEAVNTLSARFGTLFVIAAGNSGGTATVSSPGSADAALTVGAVDRDDNLARFSSRGPRIGDGAIKPDLTAPGVDIVAALHADGTINPPVEPGYTNLSGTSMATPHVAGAAALLAQQHPDWTGAQLKAVLSASAKPKAGLTAFEQGAGRVDVAKAIGQSIVSEPTNVSLGTVAWPHDDDEPVAKPLTYRNLGTAEVTLTLALDAAGPDGEPAPDGMFSLSENEITVPAGGTAQVSVTGDTTKGSVDGFYTGAVVATSGDATARTPLAIDREVESYNLTLNHVDDTGAPTSRYGTLVLGTDNSADAAPYDEDGSVTVRLPKGHYLLDSMVVTTRSGADHYNLILRPDLVLDGDKTVTVDPKQAKPISVTPPAPATLAIGDIGYELTGVIASAFLTNDLSAVSTGHVGPPLDTFTGKINTQWTDADGSLYGLAWFPVDEFPTGFTKVVDKKELATVNTEFGAVTPDRTGLHVVFPQPEAGGGFVFGVAAEVSLPGTRTAYVTTDGVAWTALLEQLNGEASEARLSSARHTYRAGRTYQESFNHAVFGPTLPDDGFHAGWVFRGGDEITVLAPLYGDAAGNAGFSIVDSAMMRLYRGDELIGEVPGDVGAFEVPPEEADYRVTVETTRPDVFDVSTAVSAEWTFRSGHVDGEEFAPLDVSVVRFLPKLDATNSAPAGRPYLIPALLQHNGGDLARAKRLDVEVSYDEGKSWQPADVLANVLVMVDHPAGATSVSLRASATAQDGNTVKQTIIRAYKLK